MNSLTKPQRIASWVCRLTVAIILLQTLFFKFTDAEESVYIFTRLGLEPWGRYGSGLAELIASVLLLTPRWVWAGAFLTCLILGGAIFSHVTVLGLAIQGDGGLLFGLALVAFSCALVVEFLHRHEIPVLKRWFQTQSV